MARSCQAGLDWPNLVGVAVPEDRSLAAAEDPFANLAIWRKALVGNTRATPFQWPDWIATLWAGRPSLWVADLGMGVAPLYMLNRHGTRTWHLMGADYEDIISEPGRETECVGALLEALRARRDWDICDFRSLLPDSALLQAFVAEDGRFRLAPELKGAMAGFSAAVLPHQVYFNIQIPPTWKEYEAHLGKKLAYQLRAEQGRRDRNFGHHEIRCATETTFDDDVTALMELNNKRWQKRGDSGAFPTEEHRALFREGCRAMLAQDKLRLFTLWVDGGPASALLTMVDARRYYHFTNGWDPEFQKFRPVKVLIAHAIQDGIAHGRREFDFMKGIDEYKAEWANSSRQNHRLIIARKTPRGLGALWTLQAQAAYTVRRQQAKAASLGVAGAPVKDEE